MLANVRKLSIMSPHATDGSIMNQIHHYPLDNGIHLLLEPVPGARSVGVNLRIPAGTCCEPAGLAGLGSVMSDMLLRGAGDQDARAQSDAMDRLGLRRQVSVLPTHLLCSMRMVGSVLHQALPLLADMLQRPHLSAESFAPAVDLAIQAVQSLEDEPQQRVIDMLQEAFFPAPINRNSLGTIDGLNKLTPADVRTFCNRHLLPGDAIFAMAGDLEPEQVHNAVCQHFGNWQGKHPLPPPAPMPQPVRRYQYHPSNQCHLMLATPTIAEHDPMSMYQHLAIAVLSGGMSGRLFTEVRENLGLCYAIHAGYGSHPAFGYLTVYAGTRPDQVQSLIEVVIDQFDRLGKGVSSDEFQRAVVGLKTQLVMHGESTGARAASLAGDFFQIGRTRSLESIAAQIDQLNLATFNRWLAQRPAMDPTIVCLGPLDDHEAAP